MKSEEIAPLILPLGIVVGGGLIAYKLGLLDFRSGAEKTQTTDTDTKAITVEAGQLHLPLAAYKSIADNSYREINSLFLTKDALLISYVENLNGNELRQVYKDFGMRCDSYQPGLPGDWTFCVGDKHNIFWWYEKTMSGATLTRMKQIWKRAALGW